MKRKPIVGITMGDPVGIGPEIIAKALSRPDLYSVCSPLIIGDASVMEQISARLGLGTDYSEVENAAGCAFGEGSPEVLQPAAHPCTEIPWGKPGELFCKAAIGYVEAAIDLCISGEIDALTTAPVNKGELVKAGFAFTGHTELLAQRTGAEEYAMMLAGEDFRVVLATTHIPLYRVAREITKMRILSLLRLIDRSMPLWGIEHPRIGVAALNPHAGDEEAVGDEEAREIIPAIEAARSESINACGPYPADTLFTTPNRKCYDVFLAMYHDQGLIPLKSESFLSAVNVTLGLPIVRTSVDHGTAYDIAGKGRADPTSLINAVKLAAKLAGRRSSGGE
jgi:4-hydroxythreonine-4-phosphate dehydrogenase